MIKALGAVLSIQFEDAIAWAGNDGFNETWLGGDAGTGENTPFNTDDLTFNNNADGKAALTRILGLRGPGADAPVEALRSVAIGDETGNTISTANASGAWVIDGRGGDDTITLGADTGAVEEAEEIVYRLAIADSDNAITNPDGSDEVSEFDLGTDMLAFVDTMGEPPAATTTPEASAVDVLMGAFESVSLDYDGTNYTGITFGIDGTATLQITFAEALAQTGLIEALGSTIADTTTLAGVFTGGVPTAGSSASATLSAAGEMLIDTLFGMTGDENNISIGASLPAELL